MKKTLTFGKVGRPPDDRFARQFEIFEAVTPLILAEGARRLTMRQAARAACLSVGGLYHYFPTKRRLVLFALEPEALSRRCRDFHQRNRRAAAEDPRRHLDSYVNFAVQGVRFIQPSIQAALELGVDTFWDVLDAALNLGAEQLRETKRATSLEISEESLDQLEHSLRRTMLAACLDKRATPEALRHDIYIIINGYSDEALREPATEPMSSGASLAPAALAELPAARPTRSNGIISSGAAA